jgi:hypothetical protein
VTDQELVRGLKELGLDGASFGAVALLPLVEVAWADRAVQPAERAFILEVAAGHRFAEGRAGQVLEGWLTTRPTPEQFELGRRLMVALTLRPRGSHARLSPHTVDAMLDLCSHLAAEAGGLFGYAFTVTPDERRAIRRIAEHVRSLEPAPPRASSGTPARRRS